MQNTVKLNAPVTFIRSEDVRYVADGSENVGVGASGMKIGSKKGWGQTTCGLRC